jgi:predicted dehydrogenase
MENTKKKSLSRRGFIKSAGLLAGAVALPFPGIGWAGTSPNEKPNLAFIGIGGRGSKNIGKFEGLCNFVAFADVDENSRKVQEVRDVHKNVPFFTDYRKMLDKMHSQIDAVVISIPDHAHYAAATWAISAGKHVYVEKPLTHTIDEARRLKEKARKAGVVSQMGNQSFSNDGVRVCKEWIDAGFIGNVEEVILWTDRLTPGQIARSENGWPVKETIPPGLDWKLWLNVAQDTDYSSKIINNWRGWWRFGSGALGDIGCHMIGIPFFALDLPYPRKVTARQRGGTSLKCPLQSKIQYEFEEANRAKNLRMTWHSGFRRKDGKREIGEGFDRSFLPEIPKMFPHKDNNKLSDNGQFIVGDKGLIYIPKMHLGKKPVLLPQEKWEDVKNNLPEPVYERVDNHWLNFIKAVKGEVKQASSDFEVSADLTEIVLLGNLALQSGDPIRWDAESMRCKGNSKANELISFSPSHPEFITKEHR